MTALLLALLVQDAASPWSAARTGDWIKYEITTRERFDETVSFLVKMEESEEREGWKTTKSVRLGKRNEIQKLITKEVACDLYKIAEDRNGEKVTRKEWRADAVPGGLLRAEQKRGDAVTVTDVAEYGVRR